MAALKLSLRGGALMVSLALSSAAGCLLVTPLEDVPVASGGTSQGGSGHSGKGPSDDAGGAGSSGADGSGAVGECASNADCVRQGSDAPFRCRPSDHQCVALRSEACPRAYGEVTSPNAVYFGAFATINPVRPDDNSVVSAYNLALEELNSDGNGGLPGAAKSPRRPLVMVVCSNVDDLVETGMSFLADEVQVSAVLANLRPGDVRRAYETHVNRDIFYLSPVAVTRSLVTEEDDAHIWNLLGQPSDFAPSYAALLARSEAYLRKTRKLDADIALKVLLVTTGDAFDAELADSITPVLEFNGKSATANAANFKRVTIGVKPKLDELSEDITAFGPDIIVSAANETFLATGGLQEQVESDWDILAPLDKPRPFYLLSPYNAGSLAALTARISGKLDSQPTLQDQQRYVGISIAAARDSSLQNAYAVRLGSLFGDAISDTANYYDAVYYLAYAMYGANEPAGLTGNGITRGMQRLLDGTSFDIGPQHISDTFDALKTGATVRLNSTLGPPGFDPETGVRAIEGSMFCFSRSKNSASFEPDVLRYDAATNQLLGNPTCIPGF